jgi:cytochrome c biogenesis protein ResB
VHLKLTTDSTPDKGGAAIASPLRALVLELGSVKAAVAVAIPLAVACVLGTLLPQGSAAAVYFERLPHANAWWNAAAALGFTHVFSSWWFLGLLFICASSVGACTAYRLAVARRATGVEARRAFGSALTHASLLLIFAGALTRAIWGETGTIRLREGETTAEFNIAAGKRPLPFAMRLEKFVVEVEPTPKLLASSQASVGTTIKDLKSTVTVTERGVSAPAVIAVNQPLVRAGWRVFQTTSATRYADYTEMQVVRDPGGPLVYAGFALLIGALIFTLFINRRINSRRDNA